MNYDEVKKHLEEDCNPRNGSIVDSMAFKFFEPFVVQGIKVDLVEPGRLICSMIIPPRLLVPLSLVLLFFLHIYIHIYMGHNSLFDLFIFLKRTQLIHYTAGPLQL